MKDEGGRMKGEELPKNQGNIPPLTRYGQECFNMQHDVPGCCTSDVHQDFV